MIFKSPWDTQGHSDSSEIFEFLAGKLPILFYLFHAVFIIIVWKPNTFYEHLLHPFLRKLFLHLKEATLHLQ